MGWPAFARFLFIQYCIVAGVLLSAAPWSLVWDRILLQAARTPWLMQSLDAPVGRAAITGFGLVHLLWGAHDLEVLILGRVRAGKPESAEEHLHPVAPPFGSTAGPSAAETALARVDEPDDRLP